MAFLYRRDRRLRGLKAERGFTLIEVVIVMSILAISIGIALPSFRGVLRNTNVSNQTNDLVTALATARSEAVRRGRQVAVMSNSGGADWSSGWQIMADSTGDGTFAAPDEVVSASPPLDGQYHVFAKNGGAGGDGRIVFNINGGLSSAGFDMNVCYPTGDATKSRRIRVRVSGSVSSQKNTSGSPATACPAGT
jgi:type IV fimbrial biogenesis protein FimT